MKKRNVAILFEKKNTDKALYLKKSLSGMFSLYKPAIFEKNSVESIERYLSYNSVFALIIDNYELSHPVSSIIQNEEMESRYFFISMSLKNADKDDVKDIKTSLRKHAKRRTERFRQY